MNPTHPEILAPAGDKNSFLAAILAGADAIYCGLKIFSARMEADNFNIEELSCLTKLAHSKNIKVYIAFNSLIKESEIMFQPIGIIETLDLVIIGQRSVQPKIQPGLIGHMHIVNGAGPAST